MLRRFVSAAETEKQELPGQVNHWYFKDGLGDAEHLVFSFSIHCSISPRRT